MTNEDFVSYEIAVKLKELGFDWPCSHYYTKENAADDEVWLTTGDMDNRNADNIYPFFLTPLCSAPTMAQAQKWLREVKGIDVYVIPRSQNAYEVAAKHLGKRAVDTFFAFDLWDRTKPYQTYESALSAGVEVALKLIEEGER